MPQELRADCAAEWEGRRKGQQGKQPKETAANVKSISGLYLEEDILPTFAKLLTSFHAACLIQL